MPYKKIYAGPVSLSNVVRYAVNGKFRRAERDQLKTRTRSPWLLPSQYLQDASASPFLINDRRITPNVHPFEMRTYVEMLGLDVSNSHFFSYIQLVSPATWQSGSKQRGQYPIYDTDIKYNSQCVSKVDSDDRDTSYYHFNNKKFFHAAGYEAYACESFDLPEFLTYLVNAALVFQDSQEITRDTAQHFEGFLQRLKKDIFSDHNEASLTQAINLTYYWKVSIAFFDGCRPLDLLCLTNDAGLAALLEWFPRPDMLAKAIKGIAPSTTGQKRIFQGATPFALAALNERISDEQLIKFIDFFSTDWSILVDALVERLDSPIIFQAQGLNTSQTLSGLSNFTLLCLVRPKVAEHLLDKLKLHREQRTKLLACDGNVVTHPLMARQNAFEGDLLTTTLRTYLCGDDENDKQSAKAVQLLSYTNSHLSHPATFLDLLWQQTDPLYLLNQIGLQQLWQVLAEKFEKLPFDQGANMSSDHAFFNLLKQAQFWQEPLLRHTAKIFKKDPSLAHKFMQYVLRQADPAAVVRTVGLEAFWQVLAEEKRFFVEHLLNQVEPLTALDRMGGDFLLHLWDSVKVSTLPAELTPVQQKNLALLLQRPIFWRSPLITSTLNRLKEQPRIAETFMTCLFSQPTQFPADLYSEVGFQDYLISYAKTNFIPAAKEDGKGKQLKKRVDPRLLDFLQSAVAWQPQSQAASWALLRALPEVELAVLLPAWLRAPSAALQSLPDFQAFLITELFAIGKTLNGDDFVNMIKLLAPRINHALKRLPSIEGVSQQQLVMMLVVRYCLFEMDWQQSRIPDTAAALLGQLYVDQQCLVDDIAKKLTKAQKDLNNPGFAFGRADRTIRVYHNLHILLVFLGSLDKVMLSDLLTTETEVSTASAAAPIKSEDGLYSQTIFNKGSLKSCYARAEAMRGKMPSAATSSAEVDLQPSAPPKEVKEQQSTGSEVIGEREGAAASYLDLLVVNPDGTYIAACSTTGDGAPSAPPAPGALNEGMSHDDNQEAAHRPASVYPPVADIALQSTGQYPAVVQYQDRSDRDILAGGDPEEIATRLPAVRAAYSSASAPCDPSSNARNSMGAASSTAADDVTQQIANLANHPYLQTGSHDQPSQ